MSKIKSFAEACKATKRNPKHLPDVSMLPESDREYIIAIYQLGVITEALNMYPKTKNLWVPDWGDENEYKYWPWFYMGGTDGAGFRFHDSTYEWTYTCSGIGSRFCFRTRALSDYAGTQFIDLYRKIMVIPKKLKAAA